MASKLLHNRFSAHDPKSQNGPEQGVIGELYVGSVACVFENPSHFNSGFPF